MTKFSQTPIPQAEFAAALDAIHLEVGRCIAEWYLVEETLNYVHTMAVMPVGAYHASLSASFNKVASFELRLGMVTSAMDNMHIHSSMKQPYEARSKGWRKVRNKLKEYNEQRNKVAHGAAVSPLQQHGVAYAIPVWVPFFESTAMTFSDIYSDMTLENSRQFEKMNVEDLRAIRAKFSHGTQLLQKFLEEHHISITGNKTV